MTSTGEVEHGAVRASPSAVPMPRVMFSTPEARPDWWWGTEPMIAALLGGVKQAETGADQRKQAQETQCRRAQGAEGEEPDRHERHPSDREGTGPEAISQATGERSDDPECERHHHELEPGARRADSQPPLEIEGDEEENAEHDQVRQEPTGDTPAEP